MQYSKETMRLLAMVPQEHRQKVIDNGKKAALLKWELKKAKEAQQKKPAA